MTAKAPGPPRLAAVLLRLSLPAGIVRDSILGDFWEEYGQRLATGSSTAARLWYWRQALGLGGRSLTRRMSFWRSARTEGAGRELGGDGAPTRPPLAFGAGGSSQKRGSLLDDLTIDLRYGWRQLLRRPTFTVMVVLTLAVGIGPNVALFSVMKGLVLRSLPYPEPERVVAIWQTETSWQGRMPLSAHAYDTLRADNNSFSEIGVYEPYNFNFRDEGEPIRVRGVACTASVLRALGVEPARGRLFTDDEEDAGRNRVVIISDGFWSRRYGADREIVGRLVNINGSDYTIIGVMPESFEIVSPWGGTARPDIHLPISLDRGAPNYRTSHWLLSLGRLKPGVSHEAAEADIRGIAARLAEELPNNYARLQVWIDPLLRSALGGVAVMLVFLLVLVGVVLLIACANVASMLLARGTYRMTELAVRAAMGAGRRRLVRQLLTESLLLSFIGGIVAVLFALWGVVALKEMIPGRIPRIEGVQIDGWVLFYTVVITTIAGMIFGLAPALFASRSNLAGALKEGLGIDQGWRSRRRSLRVLLAVQIAMAFALVNAATLLVVSYNNVISVPFGFDGTRVLLASVYTDGQAYQHRESRMAFWRELTERVEEIPGVEVAAATTKLPLRGGNNGFVIDANDSYDPTQRGILTEYSWVLPGYIEAMGIPLLEGRTLDQDDQETSGSSPGSQLPVVVNQALVDRFWPGEGGIGKRLRQNLDPPMFQATIVGVVDNVRQTGLEQEDPRPEIYFPYAPITSRPTYLVARTEGDPNALIPAVRQIVGEIDSNLVVTATSMGEIVEMVAESRRFSMVLVSLFAGTALFLVVAGTYGIMSYSVSQRVRELGVRVALGAGRGRLMLDFLASGLRFAALGIGMGFVAAIWGGLITWNRVFGVNPFDLRVILVGALLMLFVILAAIAVPVYRASRIDPMEALRTE